MKRICIFLLASLTVAAHAEPPLENKAATQPIRTYGRFSFLPVGEVFEPLMADPKERQFFMSMLGLHSSIGHMTAWSTGFGESLGLVGWDMGPFASQLGFSAGVFSQFNWSSKSHDLINTDFLIGFATTHRWDDFSLRLQYYHQSSHLGDELLINRPIPRINLSYEAMEALAAWDWGPTRFYGGGEYLLVRDPPDLKREEIHAGTEYRAREPRSAFLRPVAALDMKWRHQQNWYPNLSLKSGVELGKPTPRNRRLRILAEYYHGFSPFGQFYDARMEYWGLGLYLGF